jgi:adenylate cyclase class 2
VREIEVKYLLEDSEALLAALRARCIEPGEPACQDDQAYAGATLGAVVDHSTT